MMRLHAAALCVLLHAVRAEFTPLLSHFRVVLVAPSQPGNVGVISRSCANFECPSLHIVDPQYDRSDAEASSYERRFAVQEQALSLLRNAEVHETLSDALADCTAAVAFTRRRGVDRMETANVVAVGGLAELGDQVVRDGGSQIALVFGREASGLLSSEVLECTHVCEIATSAVQGSMSLPSAATFALGRTFEEALAAEEAQSSADGGTDALRPLGGDTTNLRAARHRPRATAGGSDTPSTEPGQGRSRAATLATLEEVRRFVDRWEQLTTASDEIEDGASTSGWVRTSRGARPATTHGRATLMLRRILHRARPTSRELRALHGVLGALERERSDVA